MEHALHHLIQWINENPHWSGIITFLISTSESVAVIGTIIPGSVMMTAIGSLIGAGILPFWSTMGWAILGAIAGDGISYGMGYYFKDNIDRIWPFTRHPDWLEKGRYFFHKHGGKSVFFGRFIGPIRAIVPLIAGSLSMRPLKFFVANVLSGIGWAPAYMLPGLLLGAAAQELPSDIAGKFMLLLLGILLLLLLITWLINLTITHFMRFANWGLDKLWKESPESNLTKMMKKILHSVDPDATHGQLGHVLALILTLIAFLVLMTSTMHHGIATQLNTPLHHFFRSIYSARLSAAMLGISMFGEKWIVLPAVVISAFLLLLVRQPKNAFFWFFNAALTANAIIIVKNIVQSARPTGIVLMRHGYSFPSGHTTLTIALYGFFCYLFSIKKSGATRWGSFITVTTLGVLVAISRLYLGVHWFSDVLGGGILGSTCLLISIILYKRVKTETLHPYYFPITVLISLLFTGSWFIAGHYSKYLANYHPVWETTHISKKIWWKSKGELTPSFRKNRFGMPVQAINLQWASQLHTIKKLLASSGWKNYVNGRKQKKFELEHNIKHLYLPLHLYKTRRPSLTMTHTSPKKTLILVLRLWTSDLDLTDTPLPLWIGTINAYNDEKKGVLFESEKWDHLDTTSEFRKLLKNSVFIKRVTTKHNTKLLLIKSKK
jgi:membrane protein DedA with SNARE-associated domain/membrane-associated phospholipid phosphatase